MGPVIVHHYYFVEELLIAFISPVEVLDCYDVGRVGDRVEYNIALDADGPNDSDIILLGLCPLNNQWQNRIPWLPYL